MSFRCVVSALVCSTALFLFSGCGGPSSGGNTTTPPASAPTLTAVAPASAVAGSAATTVTLTGTNFLPSTTVEVAGTNVARTYVSATSLTAVIPATQLATAGSLSIVAKNGSDASAPVSFTVTAPAAAPTLTAVTPASAAAGSAATTITLTGTNFLSTTTVEVSGTAVAATYVSATSMTAVIPAGKLASAGSLGIVAKNGTAASGSVPFTVTAPAFAPTISSISPASFNVGSPAITVVLTGANFLSTTTVEVDGTAVATTYLSPASISFVMPAAKLASAGTISVVAKNGGAASPAIPQPVNNATPVITSLSPASFQAGTTGTPTVTITGTGFLSSSTITVNGVTHVATYLSNTQLTTKLSAADIATAATLPLVVHNPSPGGGDSAPADISITAGLALTAISPSTLPPGGTTPVTITLTGTGFTPTTHLEFNGNDHSSTYVNSTTITFVLSPSEQGPDNHPVRLRTDNYPSSLHTAYLYLYIPFAITLSSVQPAMLYTRSGDTTIHLYGANMPPDPLVHWKFVANSTIQDTSFTGTRVSANEITVTVPTNVLTLEGSPSIWITSASLSQGSGTIYIRLVDSGFVSFSTSKITYSAANGKFYITPGLGAPASYASTVVPFDPVKQILDIPIPVAGPPGQTAVSDDGVYLWVSLPSLGAVQRVNLTTGVADPPFSLPPVPGGSNPSAICLLPIPGQPNSVFLSIFYNLVAQPYKVGIFDAGVLRGSFLDRYVGWASVDTTKSEISAVGVNSYTIFGYNSTGLTQKLAHDDSNVLTAEGYPDIAVAGGNFYTSFGRAFSLADGTLVAGSYAAGTVAADTTLNKLYTVDSQGSLGSSVEMNYVDALHTYSLSTGVPVLSNELPLLILIGTLHWGPERMPINLTRWGTNGLAFRSLNGMYSLRSVAGAPVSSTDLAVTATSSGTPAQNVATTYTATVLNNGGPATNVLLSTMFSDNTTFTSVSTTAGSCSVQIQVRCSLGSLASGASATVTYTVVHSAAGPAGFSWKADSTEPDSYTNDNTAVIAVNVSN
ncbi:MAG: IPT/TIG domain-containing protein [Acidobacteria bacterium]|nr:IPT/TIG domain-containing protein [Acidobacteriota bacterium]